MLKEALFAVEIREGVPKFLVEWPEGADVRAFGEILFHIQNGDHLDDIYDAARSHAAELGGSSDFDDLKEGLVDAFREMKARVEEEMEEEQGVGDEEDPDSPLICPTEAIPRLLRRGQAGG